MIGVLELRNYLLKPESSDIFRTYFNTHFVEPMKDLGGLTLGQFKVKDSKDRFVWLRGFSDMKSRSQFQNDFYLKSPTWKTFGPGANDLMINSDHVHLLKPLYLQDTFGAHPLTRVDFYICNGTREKVIKLFEDSYIPFLQGLPIDDISMWVSEMEEADFPRQPVFQDKNLIVIMTRALDEAALHRMPADLKKSMQGLITTQSHWILVQHDAFAG